MNLTKFNTDVRRAAELLIAKRPIGAKLIKSLAQAFSRASCITSAPDVFHKYEDDHSSSVYDFSGEQHVEQFYTIQDLYSLMGDKEWRLAQDRFSVLMQHAEIYSGTENAFDSFPIAMRAMQVVSTKFRDLMNMGSYQGIVYFCPQDSDQYRAYSGLELIHGANHLKHDSKATNRIEHALAGQAGMDTYNYNSWPSFSYDNIVFHLGHWDSHSKSYYLPNEEETQAVKSAAYLLKNNPQILFEPSV